MVAGREGGREGQWSKGKKRFKWWRSAAGWMCPQMICARMGGRDGTEGRGGEGVSVTEGKNPAGA